MTTLLLANTHIDWAALTESGLTAVVVTAVFVIIVKPMVAQMLKNNAESAKAYLKLAETISNGNNSIRENTKRAEAKVLTSFNDLVEPLTILKERIKDMNTKLDRIESKISEK